MKEHKTIVINIPTVREVELISPLGYNTLVFFGGIIMGAGLKTVGLGGYLPWAIPTYGLVAMWGRLHLKNRKYMR